MTWRPAAQREPVPITDPHYVEMAVRAGIATPEERTWYEQGCPPITREPIESPQPLSGPVAGGAGMGVPRLPIGREDLFGCLPPGSSPISSTHSL